jgi:hypothetical protein
MLAWIIQISLISIILIFLVHHLLMFFKTTLTVPKIKDLVDSPNQKYQSIFNIISSTNLNPADHPTNSLGQNSYTSIDLLPSDLVPSDLVPSDLVSSGSEILSSNFLIDSLETSKTMKNELKSFLKQRLNASN